MNCNNLQNILLKNLYACCLLGIVCIKGSRRRERAEVSFHVLTCSSCKLVALSTGWSWQPRWKGDATLFLMD